MSSLDKTGLAYFFSKISQIFCKRSMLITVEVKAENWIGDSAPFSQTLTVNGVTATSVQEILPELNVSASTLIAIKNAGIEDGGQSNNTITLIAFGDKPTIDFNIRVIIRGDM